MAATYQVLRMETIGTPPFLDANGIPHTFKDPEHAARFARDASKIIGEKLCVKAVVNDAWRQREDERFRTGEYRMLPWSREIWWQQGGYPIWKDHYPHASLEKPGWIAYTKSPEDGERDKQSLLRPGSYLERYFSTVLDRYGVSQRKLVESFMRMYGPIDIKFAKTEDEIVKVYDLLQTCMAGKRWPKNIHPASLYAAGDLEVAYIGDLEKGRVSARSLVWPAKKIHSRIYGDIARLTQGLQRLGYKWGPPIGAKIKRYPHAKVDLSNGRVPNACFLAPYIDKKNQQGGGHLALFDRETHLEICAEGEPGSHHAGQPDGYTGLYVPRLDERPTFVCDHCDKRVTEQLFDVIVREIDEDDDDEEDIFERECWCHNCTARRAIPDGFSGDYVSHEIQMVDVGGQLWLPRYARMYARRCEGSGELTKTDDLRAIYFKDGTCKVLSPRYIARNIGNVFRSMFTDRPGPAKEAVRVKTNPYGETGFCLQTEVAYHTFMCDGCDSLWRLMDRKQVTDDDRLFCPECAEIVKHENRIPVSKLRKAFDRERGKIGQPELQLSAAE